MIKHLFLKLSLAFLFINTLLDAQCTYTSSISDVTLNCSGGSTSRSGVAYNPTSKLYYSVNAGSSGYPLETFGDKGGNPINTTNCGADYRGYWFNTSTGLPEGNTYNSGGLYSNSLNGSGYATNTANYITPANMPNSQCNAACNFTANLVFYYQSGVIYKYNRSTGAFISSVTITGLPVSTTNLAIYSIIFTGISGSEAGVYDYNNKKIYFINYNTGAYVSSCTLFGYPYANTDYGVSFANNRVFIFDLGSYQWVGFPIVNTTCAASALNFDGYDDYVYFPTSASWWTLGNNFTVEMWIKPQSLNNQIIMYGGYGCITCPQWELSIGSELTCGYGGSAGKIVFTTISDISVESDASPTPWMWTHVAVTFSGGVMKMYVDGKLQQMQSRNPGATIGVPSYMVMGMDPGCGGRYPYAGYIDEFRVWNTERTQCQIEQYMNCQIPTTATNLLCNFHFDQGNANNNNSGVNTLTDAAGSASGNLYNFTLSGPLSNWVAPSPVVNSYTTAASQAVSINVTGNGSSIADGDVTPSTSDFTDFNGNVSRTFVIQNTVSGGTLDIAAYLTGLSAADFSITTVPSSSIVGIGSTSITVTVLAGGTRTATLNIVNNDCNSSKSLYDFVITSTQTNDQAINCDGVDDYIYIPTNILVYDFTIEYWMRTTQNGGGGGQWWTGKGIVDAETPGINDDYGTSLVGSKWAFGIGNPDVTLFSTSDVNTGQWVHVAAVRQGGNMYLYINGVLEATGSASGNGRYAPWGITIGSLLTLVTYYNGDVDDVRLWNVARTQCQIEQYMNCEIPGSSTGLVGNYHFNQGTTGNNAAVTTLIDESGYRPWGVMKNGGLNNFALTGSTSNWITAGKIVPDYTVVASSSSTINLKGNGTTILNNSTATSTLNFTSFGSVSSRSFVVQNTGTGLLAINNVTITGTNSSEFSVTSISSGTMGTSGTSTVVIAFTPTTGGLRTATVEIRSTDCTTPLFKFAIDGQAPTAEALSLDGVDDLASHAILTTNTVNLTLQAKVYWRGVTGQAQMIMYNGHSSIRGCGIYVNSGTGVVQILYGGVSFTPFNYTLSTNVWTSLTAVVKNGIVECYANGVLVSVTNVSNPSTPNSGLGDLFTVGSNAVGNENFNGIFDEVRFWDKALTQCEIQTYLNCEIPGAMTNLLANYHFNQGSPGLSNTSVSTATDASGNNNTLNLVNMALTGTLSNWVSPGAIAAGFTTTTPPTASITVTGNATGISYGSTSTSTLNYTDFGSAASRTFVIQNAGTGTLNIGTPYLTGVNSSEFSVTVLPATTLAAAATTSFVIAFSPTGGGARTATVNINDNDCAKPIFNYAIQGTPVAGAALNFDGSNDYVDLGVILPASYTKEAWIKMQTGAVDYDFISGGNGTTVGSALFAPNAYGNFLAAGHNGTWSAVIDVTALSFNTWYHVAVTYDAPTTTMKLYKNGTLVSTNTNVAVCSSNDIYIGGVTNFSNHKGTIDEVRIWNRALCAPEIQNNMNCEIPTTAPGLIANYHFNQAYSAVNNSTATLLTDFSGASHTGTLTNFALTGTLSNWIAPGAVTSGSSCSVYLDPEINLVGNGNSIVDGDNTPSTTDNTDFGGVCINSTIVKTFTLQNIGTATLSVGTMSMFGSGAGSFTIGTLSPASPVAAAGSAVFSVTFAPVSSGVKTATINIPSNDCDEALYDFVLTGTCNALPTVTASASSPVVCSGFSTTLNGSGANTYTWTGGVTNGVAFAPSASLTYTVNGTNTLTGCTSTNSATQLVTVNPLPTVAVSTPSSAICIGNSTTLTATNANTYTWNPGGIVGGTVTVSPTSNTNYTITGTNTITGCTSTNIAVLNITVNALPTVTANVSSSVICVGVTTTLTATGASTYTWSPGALTGSAVSVTPATTTTYSLVGTSTAGCTSTNSATRAVTVNPLPTVSITPNTTVVCAGFPANLVGTGANTYTWNPGGITGTTLTPSPLTTSNYSLVGTSTAGCTSTNSAVQSVSVNALPVIAVSSVSMSICINGSTTLTATNAHTYTWNPGALTGSAIVVSPTANTGYTATGTSTITGCTSTNVAVLNITVNALPTVSASVNGSVICFGNSPTLTASGASTYTWNPGNMIGTTATPTPAANTTYSLVGTSTAGCTSTNSATRSVTVNPLPTVTIVPVTTVICAGGTANIAGTGANTYTWNPGGTSATTLTPVLFTSTNYSLVGTSTAGCTSTNSAVQSISVNALPTVSASSSNSVICNTGTTSLIGLGADTYTWSGSIPNNTPFSPSVTTGYTVNGTSTLTGCTSTNSAVQTISVNITPSVNVSAVNSTVCAGVTTTIMASGANSYSWNPGALTGSLITPNPTVTTAYTVVGGSAAGCLSTPVIQTIAVNPLPVVTANAPTLAICFGGSVTLNGAGASTYAWNNGAVNNVAFSPGATTSYTVTGTDANNCQNTASLTITVYTLPIVTANITNTTICLNDQVSLSGSGATTYTWTGGVSDGVVFTPTATGSYSLVGSFSTGCTSTNVAVAAVSVNPLPVVGTHVTNSVICFGAQSTLSGNGATSYVWSGGVTDNVAFSPSVTATYTVTGTDVNTCTNSAVASITVNNLPVLTVASTSSSNCEAVTVTLTVSGANTYTWNTSQTGTDLVITPTVSTTYSVNALDLNGCANTATFMQMVSVCPGTLHAFPHITDLSCHGKNDGKIYIEVNHTYTNATVQYFWNGQNCPTNDCDSLNKLKNGTYSVLVKVTYTLNSVLVKTDSVMLTQIEVRDDHGDCEITAYTGISANGDGLNDVFTIFNIDQFPNNKVTVYSRWGEKMYEVNGYNNLDKSWPEKGEVSKLKPNTYFYIIDKGDGSKPVKGWVELIK